MRIEYVLLPSVLVAIISYWTYKFTEWVLPKIMEHYIGKEDAFIQLKRTIVICFFIINLNRLICMVSCMIGLLAACIRVCQIISNILLV